MRNNNKRWLSVLGITVMVVLLVACSGSSSKGGNGTVNGAKINVLVKDFSFSLDRLQIEAGTITFIIQNKGSISHDFTIQGNGVEQRTPLIEPGETTTLTVNLEPGTYTYVCTIPRHKESGMIGIFTVTSN